MRGGSVGLFLVLAVAVAAAGASVQALPDRCRVEPVHGSGKALLKRFAFDQGRKKCVPFFYGGDGSGRPFDTMQACRALCETGAEVRLAGIRRVEGMPFALVDLEYPKDWKEDLAFVAKVSGKEVASRRVGGGFTTEANDATLEVFLGTGSVTDLSIETTVGGKTYRVFTSLPWTTAPLLLLLDHTGNDEALLAPAALRFVAYKAGAPVVRHNGAKIAAEPVIGVVGKTMLWRVAPKWTAGRNTVSVEATGTDGTSLRRDYTFVNLADGRLRLRQKAILAYGAPGSRSGPFYRLAVTGRAVALGTQATVDIEGLDEWGWLERDQRLVRTIVGAAPGEAILRIYEQPSFLGPEHLSKEIRLRVSP